MYTSLTLSVVTANFNNAKFLNCFFDSFIQSSDLPDEIIFVDDASTDNSLDIVRNFQDRLNITIIALKQNKGFANALNEGLKEAKGKFIMRVDPDDFIHFHRVEIEKQFLAENPHISIIGSNTFYYNSKNNKVVGKSHFPINYERIVKGFKRGYITISGGSFTARKEVFEHIQYKQEFVPFEEYVFFSEVLQSNFIAHNINLPLTYYRVHNQNRTFDFFYRKEKNIKTQRERLWGSKSLKTSVFCNTFDGYFYWKSFKTTNRFTRIFYLFVSIVFKLFKRILH